MKVKVVYFSETHGLIDTFVFDSIYKLGGFQFKSINTVLCHLEIQTMPRLTYISRVIITSMLSCVLKCDSVAVSPLVAEYDNDIQRLKTQIASFQVSYLCALS